MMLGMESVTGGMLEAGVAGLVQECRGPVPAVESGEETPGCYQTRWHGGTTAVQSHAALMSRHTVYSHT